MSNFNLSTSIKALLIISFVGCLFDMPYGYFQVVRYFGAVGFIYLTIDSNKKNEQHWTWIWLFSAFLINPIVKANLGRQLWNLVDICWVVILLINIIKVKKKMQ